MGMHRGRLCTHGSHFTQCRERTHSAAAARLLACLQAIQPVLKALLYTWQPGRRTAEGEELGVSVQVTAACRAFGNRTGPSARTDPCVRRNSQPRLTRASASACADQGEAGPSHQPLRPRFAPPPLLAQELPLSYRDPSLLMPVVVEHTIDERSPLYGHTHDSLEVRPRLVRPLSRAALAAAR